MKPAEQQALAAGVVKALADTAERVTRAIALRMKSESERVDSRMAALESRIAVLEAGKDRKD